MSTHAAKPMKYRNNARVAPVKEREENIDASISACGWMIDRRTVSAAATAATAYSATTGVVSHPQLGPSTVARTNAVIAVNRDTVETGSGRRDPVAARWCGPARTANATIRSPIGTLIRKI